MEALTWAQLVIAVVVATISSTGFWKYLEGRNAKNNISTKLLLGLAHDRIVQLGFSYIERGWITKDEFEDFVKYIYKPYSSFGGNGLAERVYKDVTELPILGKNPKEKENENEKG